MLDSLNPNLRHGLPGVACGLDSEVRDPEKTHERPLPDVKVGDPVIRNDPGCPEPDAPLPVDLVLAKLVPHALVIEADPVPEQGKEEEYSAEDDDREYCRHIGGQRYRYVSKEQEETDNERDATP